MRRSAAEAAPEPAAAERDASNSAPVHPDRRPVYSGPTARGSSVNTHDAVGPDATGAIDAPSADHGARLSRNEREHSSKKAERNQKVLHDQFSSDDRRGPKNVSQELLN